MADGESPTEPRAQHFGLERHRLGAAMNDAVQQTGRQLDMQRYRTNAGSAAAPSPAQVQADDPAIQGWDLYFRGDAPENFVAALALFEQAVAQGPARSAAGAGSP